MRIPSTPCRKFCDVVQISSGLAVSLLLLVSGTVGRARAQGAASVPAKVVRVTGAARYSMSGQPWQALKVGDVLAAGTLIQTAKTKATIEIQLGESAGTDANIIRLFDDT